MSRLEYLTTLIAIIIGLGLADLLESAYRLTQARKRVRFHWLPLSWALMVFLLVMIFYWTFFRIGQLAVWRNMFAFIFLLIAPVLLFLASANALPDEIPPKGTLNLEQFYFDRPRGFFLLLAGYMLHAMVLDLLRGVPIWNGEQLFQGAGFLLGLLMAGSRNRKLHKMVTLAAFALILGFIVRYALQID